MSVFIETRTDPFVAQREAMSSDIRSSGRNITPVRRPTRGFQIKEDTYAVIRIATSDGHFLPVIDAAGDIVGVGDGLNYTTSYSNFFIMNVVDQRSEKQQIVDTFGDAYIFLFGEQPRILTVAGLLINTADFNWRAEFWENYEKYFRGTRLVENSARLYLIYDDVIVEGYMMQAQAIDNSENRQVIQFNFALFVTGYTNVSAIGNPNFPQVSGVEITSMGNALTDYELGRNLQRESTTEAVRRMNLGAYQTGSSKYLTDALRDGLVSGDPSIMGFVQRVQAAASGAEALDSNQSVIGQTVRSGRRPYGVRLDDRERPVPIRSVFSDNADEFIGSEVPTPAELAAPLSMQDRWTEADRLVDEAASQFIDPMDQDFYDLMGRPGRVDQAIRDAAGFRTSVQVTSGGVSRGLPPINVRSLPFGIGVFEGTY